jgi:hypothetical protein
MAAPIAHIFLATQMLAGPFKGLFNEHEFIVGTSFPDIRYLKVVERTETHFTSVRLDDILQEKDSFKAGMLFHSYVDEQRESYILKHKIYEQLPQFRFTSQSLKFAEDEILKPHFDVALYSAYFDDVLESELAYNISVEHVRSWHAFLQGYMRGDYSGHDLIMKYFDLNEPHAWLIKRWLFAWLYARKMNYTMSLIIDNKETKHLILNFYMHFAENHAI